MTGFLINKYNWSSYVSFLILLGLVVLVALPSTRKISETAAAGLNLKSLFTITYIIFYGILAMNSGQLLRWRKSRLGGLKREKLAFLLAALLLQLLFLIFITLPYWIIFTSITYVGPLSTLWAIAHLLFWGFDLGMVGLVVGLAFKSEISQFNIKYFSLATYLIGTLFYARFANPFLAISLIQSEQAACEMQKSCPHLNFSLFFLESYATFAVAGLLLVFFTRRLMQRALDEKESYV